MKATRQEETSIPTRGLSIPAWTTGAAILVGLIALGFVLSDFQLGIASEMLIIGLFALSLNLILGYGGMVHFGHAAFYGIGGYTLAISMSQFGWSPWLGLVLAPFVSALLALVIGWFCVRRVGLYFAILTLAFGQLVYTIVYDRRELTGGDEGLHGLEFPEIISTPMNNYFFTLLVFVLCYLVIRAIVRSPFMLVLRAIRENAERARFVGVNVRLHQLVVFTIGGFFAGIAGALLVVEQAFAGPDMLFWTQSAVPILAVLLGGMFILPGPMLGAVILVFLEQTLNRIVSNWPYGDVPVLGIIGDVQWQTVLGIITVTIVLAAPNGILGLLQDWLKRAGNGNKKES